MFPYDPSLSFSTSLPSSTTVFKLITVNCTYTDCALSFGSADREKGQYGKVAMPRAMVNASTLARVSTLNKQLWPVKEARKNRHPNFLFIVRHAQALDDARSIGATIPGLTGGG
jgi:hypothetical protein